MAATVVIDAWVEVSVLLVDNVCSGNALLIVSEVDGVSADRGSDVEAGVEFRVEVPDKALSSITVLLVRGGNPTSDVIVESIDSCVFVDPSVSRWLVALVIGDCGSVTDVIVAVVEEGVVVDGKLVGFRDGSDHGTAVNPVDGHIEELHVASTFRVLVPHSGQPLRYLDDQHGFGPISVILGT